MCGSLLERTAATTLLAPFWTVAQPHCLLVPLSRFLAPRRRNGEKRRKQRRAEMGEIWPSKRVRAALRCLRNRYIYRSTITAGTVQTFFLCVLLRYFRLFVCGKQDISPCRTSSNWHELLLDGGGGHLHQWYHSKFGPFVYRSSIFIGLQRRFFGTLYATSNYCFQ